MQEQGVNDGQALKDALVAEEVAETEVFVRTKKLEMLSGSQNNKLLARNAEVVDMRVKLAAILKIVAGAEYEKGGAKTLIATVKRQAEVPGSSVSCARRD